MEDSNVPTPALSDVTVTPLPLSAGIAREAPVYPTEILVLANANASPGIENPSPPVATAAGEASWRPWLALTLVLFGVYYFVPRFVEEMQFAYTRGRQRAEFENASRLLNGSRVNQVSLEELSTTSQLVFQRIAPSVVHLNVETKSSTQPPTHELHRFYRDHAGQGSGVIIDAAGYIVTNQHVVRDAEQIRVSLSDGRSLVGKLIGTDEETDLAVIRIQAEKLIAAEWGESDDLAVGAFVWAVGSPFGLQSTVTGGIVSAKHRAGMAGTPYQDFLQTDCAVNPGSSGGPLMNTQGKIVGINTAIVGESYQGVSFAIPSRVARDVVSRIRTQGKIARGWLGIQLAEVSPEMALEQGLERAAGVYVAGLVHLDGIGPAEKAGMQTGDIVVRWNGKAVENSVALSNLVAATPVGSQAEVVLRRQGAEQTLMVEIAERPQR